MAEDDRYHHGNLRDALIHAGMELLEEAGPEGVGLRAVARRAGVSHAAPYHHFDDKAHLIEVLATRGFEEFSEVLRSAMQGGGGNPLERLRDTGIAYVRFAVRRPALFRLMNRPELRTASHEAGAPGPVEGAARATYAVLEEGVREAREAELIEAGQERSQALAAWSLVHGLAVLAIDGLVLDGVPDVDEAESLASAVTGVLGIGLLRR